MKANIKFENSKTDQMLPFHLDIPYENLKLLSQGCVKADLTHFSEVIQDTILAGIDTETKPARRRGEVNPTALIQIALRRAKGVEAVFVLDLLYLFSSKCDLKSTINECLCNLFSNKKIIKIGQGLTQDLRELRDSYPDVTAFRELLSVVDTNTLHKHIQPQTLQNISLKNFTRMYLNFNLIKKEQMSNWSIRPLTDGQMRYAACDALVLLRLYDAMRYEAEDLFSDSFNIKEFTIDLVLPAYVYRTAEQRQIIKDEKSLRRQAGMFPPGSISSSSQRGQHLIVDKVTKEDKETKFVSLVEFTHRVYAAQGRWRPAHKRVCLR